MPIEATEPPPSPLSPDPSPLNRRLSLRSATGRRRDDAGDDAAERPGAEPIICRCERIEPGFDVGPHFDWRPPPNVASHPLEPRSISTAARGCRVSTRSKRRSTCLERPVECRLRPGRTAGRPVRSRSRPVSTARRRAFRCRSRSSSPWIDRRTEIRNGGAQKVTFAAPDWEISGPATPLEGAADPGAGAGVGPDFGGDAVLFGFRRVLGFALAAVEFPGRGEDLVGAARPARGVDARCSCRPTRTSRCRSGSSTGRPASGRLLLRPRRSLPLRFLRLRGAAFASAARIFFTSSIQVAMSPFSCASEASRAPLTAARCAAEAAAASRTAAIWSRAAATRSS